MHTTLYGTINAPLYVYENGEKKLNITDYAIKEFQKKYKDKATAENIFAYCHAVLSSPKYQKEYEENLTLRINFISSVNIGGKRHGKSKRRHER